MKGHLEIRLLITGGSGFIGTNAVSYYIGKGITLLNIDISRPKDESQTPFWKAVDILNLPNLKKTVLDFNPTHVLHLAARTDLDEKQSIEEYKVNTIGVENLLVALSQCVNLKRVIFTSSMYVCVPGYNPTNYDDFAPHTLYGESKVRTENIVKKYNSETFEWVIIRPTSIWGPWFGHPYNDFFHHVAKRTYFNIIGKTATKTYGFIGNSIYQIDQIMFCEKKLVNKRVLYIGDYPGLNINAWAIEIATQFGIKLIPVPLVIIRFASWFGDFLSIFGIKFPLQSFRFKNMITDNTISLLRDTLEIAPQQIYSVKQGVALTLRWLKENENV